MSRLWALLEERGLPGRARIWPQVRGCVAAALFSVAGEIGRVPSSFELLGFDVCVDAAGRAWLLEANTSPSMEMPYPLDRALKPRLVADVLQLVDPTPFDRAALCEALQRRLGLRGRRGRGAGIFSGTQTGDRVACAADLAGILRGGRPREPGAAPGRPGLFERLAPSRTTEPFRRLAAAGPARPVSRQGGGR